MSSPPKPILAGSDGSDRSIDALRLLGPLATRARLSRNRDVAVGFDGSEES